MIRLVKKRKFYFFIFCCLDTLCLFFGYYGYKFCFGEISDGCEVTPKSVHVISKFILGHLNANTLEQRHRLDDHPTRLLYLTQTEQCLPHQLKLAIGNSSICQCDVAVLSYKKKCDEDAHVKYIYDSHTTWTMGRNLLFYTFIHNMTNRKDKYLYYIMIDDDVDVWWMDKSRSTFGNKNPWRSYEAFLRKVKPPIAALDLYNYGMQERIEKIHKKLACPIHPEYNPAVYHDGAMVAYHYQAIEHVLPYWDKLDKVSWWYSGLYSIIWNDICFHGQLVVHRHLSANNPKHRPYPRKPPNAKVISSMVDDIEQRLSKQCRKVMATLLQQHREKGLTYEKSDSTTYCLPPLKPNQTIIPFKECITDQ